MEPSLCATLGALKIGKLQRSVLVSACLTFTAVAALSAEVPVAAGVILDLREWHFDNDRNHCELPVRDNDIDIIFIIGFSGDDWVSKSGASAFVRKPFTIDSIGRTVRRVFFGH